MKNNSFNKIFESLGENTYLRADLKSLEYKLQTDELGQDLENIKNLILKSKAENKKSLLEILEKVDKAAIKYLITIIELEKLSKQRNSYFYNDEEKFAQAQKEKDFERKIAHECLIDSINIIFRNCLKNNIGEMADMAKKYSGSKDNPLFRNKIKDLAIFHIWSIIKKECL